jgi:hypothetical protein
MAAAAVPTDTIQPGGITTGITARESLDVEDEYPE